MTPGPDPSDTDALLRRWCDALAAELAPASPDPAPGGDVDVDAVLALAGVVAHGVVRPAAPLTTYLVGLAVGRAAASGVSEADAFAELAARARALAATGDFGEQQVSGP